MFVAVALRSQFLRAVLFWLSVPVKSRFEPFAFLNFNAVRVVKSEVVNKACPLLFVQKPSVSPPAAPWHTLPKLHVLLVPAHVTESRSRSSGHDVGVVAIVPAGLTSLTVYIPGSRLGNE